MLAVASPQLRTNPFTAPSNDGDDARAQLPGPRIDFEEGSSSGTLGVPEGRYKPINEQPVASTSKLPPPDDEPTLPRTPGKAAKDSSADISVTSADIIPTSWPRGYKIGVGLHNTGNTCFLNSALQCLLHTTPLLHMIKRHPTTCAVQSSSSFCMICSVRRIAADSFESKKSAFVPSPILHNLFRIAKHMRKGRQEDAHEFLRFSVDAIQRACLHGHPKKVDPKIAEATWINQIFGGKLRSRVHCLSCGHNSDTFDHIMDLSLDIQNVNSLQQALKNFVAVDHLRGADKYKCEKCKKAVNADKQFTVEAAPLALTVHLKRFTPFGKKLAHVIQYKEQVSLNGCMSDNAQAPRYNLYGVVCHAGGGPNSGHYYAYIRGATGAWYEMNDESVSPQHRPPLDVKQAYMLFYIRDESRALDELIVANGKSKSVERPLNRKSSSITGPEDASASRPTTPITPMVADRSLALAALKEAQMKRRSLPSRNSITPAANPPKPPVASKVQAPLPGLSGYSSSEDNDDVGEKVDQPSAPADVAPPSSPARPGSLPPSSPPATSSLEEGEALEGASISKTKRPRDEDEDALPIKRAKSSSSEDEMVDLDEDDMETTPNISARANVFAASIPASAPAKSKRLRDDDERSSSPAKKHKSSSPPEPSRRRSIANPFSNIRRQGHDINRKRNKGHGLLDVEPSSHPQRRKPGL